MSKARRRRKAIERAAYVLDINEYAVLRLIAQRLPPFQKRVRDLIEGKIG